MNSWCRTAGSILFMILVAGCAAERLHRQGLSAIDKGEYENGLTLLNQAAQADPHNMSYRFDYATRREAAVLGLLNIADSARGTHQLDVAAGAYRRVLAISPGNDRAQRGLAALDGDARHGDVLAQANKDFDRKDYDAAEAKVRAVLHEDPGYVPAQDLEARITAARTPVSVAPRLKTRDNHRVTLQLRDAPTKMVFEVLSRETAINFILDKDVKGDTKTTIFVTDVPVEAAIDLVLEQNALARQILADNMVLIYPNIAAKQKDYEQQIVRTFYLTNSAPKEVESMLKTVLGAKTMFIDERTSVVVLRDTPDAVHMAEKLVAAIDVAEPEVMLEVEVLEVTRSHLMDLGIQYPGSVTFTAQPSTAGGGLVLSDLKNLNSDTIGVSSIALTVNAMKQAGLANTLASPRIRVRNKEKAKVLIGSKEPVITNTTTPTAGGTAVVTGSVQYLDVGLQLEVQPTIYLDSDVSIKMQLEVSSILKQIQTASGTIAYEIGTRNANTLLRLKDGETQILAGLIQESDTRTANTIPGLGDIPILGHLFGTHHTDQEKDEIVLSITPRIIRMQPRASGDTTEFWYGTETRTRSVPYTSTTDSTSGSGPAGSSAPSGTATPLIVPGAAGVPAGGEGAGAAAATDTTGASAGAVAAGSTAALAAAASMKTAAASHGLPITTPPATVTANQPAAGASALTVDGPSQARVGDQFQVSVRLATDQSITKLRSQLRYDASALQLVDASTGDMVPAAAGGPKVDTHMAGGAQLDIGTTAEEPVQGNGTLMVLTFKAVAPRPATRVQGMLNVLNSAGAAAGNSQAPPLDIAILPAQ